MAPRTRVLTLLFAVAGLAFSGAAAWVHHRLIIDPSYISPCDINATFNCSQVYLSRFGTVAGVPVALLGVMYFALVTLVAAFNRPDRAKADDPTSAYVFALATVGLAGVLYLGYASLFILKTGCVLCIGTYVSVIGLFIVSGMATTMPMTQVPLRLSQDLRARFGRPAWLLLALLYLAGSVSLVAFFPREAGTGPGKAPQMRMSQMSVGPRTAVPAVPQDPQKAFEQSWALQDRVDLGIPADGAKVVIVKFNDWQCPACKAAHLAYGPILDKYNKTMPGAVKYVLKDYPLNSKCNVNIPSQQHPGACEAAVAVRLARAKGKDDAMITWLYANQETFTPLSVKAAAESVAGITDFDAQYPLIINDVRRDVTDGGVLQVMFTPTFYINGVKAASADGRILPPDYFDLAIQYELKKAGKH
jgi:uncharacterized membrane protein/protein-disulfide isomerase